MSNSKVVELPTRCWNEGKSCFVALIGECMMELSEPENGVLECGFAGDVLNTAVYLARESRGNDITVDFVTAIGEDPFSDNMLAEWRREGIGVKLVTRIEGKLPGLYWIKTDDQGERSFYYWRERSAARDLISNTTEISLFESLRNFNVIYFSGISIAILNEDSRAVLWRVLKKVKSLGVLIVFDTNYRPKLWSNAEEAKLCITDFLSLVDVAMVSDTDEFELFSDNDHEEIIERLHSLGVSEVVVKCGARGCCVSTQEQKFEVPTRPVIKPQDTTAAGDSFNAAYIAARILGLSMSQSAEKGHELAAKVVQIPGAIMSLETELGSD